MTTRGKPITRSPTTGRALKAHHPTKTHEDLVAMHQATSKLAFAAASSMEAVERGKYPALRAKLVEIEGRMRSAGEADRGESRRLGKLIAGEQKAQRDYGRAARDYPKDAPKFNEIRREEGVHEHELERLRAAARNVRGQNKP